MLRGTRGGSRRRGFTSAGSVMDHRDLRRWTGVSQRLDNPHRAAGVNNGLNLTNFR